MELSQADADILIGMPKIAADTRTYAYPSEGGQIHIPLVSRDLRESFFLDIERSRINLRKGKYQERARGCIVLARLDFGGPPHRNPDDEEIACPHLHIYREGFGDRWAYPVPSEYFHDVGDRWRLLQDFMSFCHIEQRPNIPPDLFV